MKRAVLVASRGTEPPALGVAEAAVERTQKVEMPILLMLFQCECSTNQCRVPSIAADRDSLRGAFGTACACSTGAQGARTGNGAQVCWSAFAGIQRGARCMLQRASHPSSLRCHHTFRVLGKVWWHSWELLDGFYNLDRLLSNPPPHTNTPLVYNSIPTIRPFHVTPQTFWSQLRTQAGITRRSKSCAVRVGTAITKQLEAPLAARPVASRSAAAGRSGPAGAWRWGAGPRPSPSESDRVEGCPWESLAVPPVPSGPVLDRHLQTRPRLSRSPAGAGGDW